MRFLDARKRGSVSWYLSAKIWRGKVRCVWRAQERSSSGGFGLLILSWRVGWRPVGRMKVDVKNSEVVWWRDGKEKRDGEGLVSSPITVKNPPRLNSSTSSGFSWFRIPTSRREGELVFGLLIERDCVVEGKNAASVKA